MLVKKSYKFKLRLTLQQEQQCAQFAGCSRFVWNKALALKKECWETERRFITQYELNNLLVQWKSELPWLSEAPAQALQQVNKDLDQAYKNFFRRCGDGQTPGYPKFKKKGKRDSFRFPQGIKLLARLNHKTGMVQLPKLGPVQFVSTRPIEGDIKNATISRTAGRWFISFSCDNVPVDLPKAPDCPVGIDRGIAVLAQCSDGSRYEAPSPLTNNINKLRRVQRKLARKKKFSSNWRPQREQLARLQHRFANIRSDSLQKNSTALAKNHGTIVIENLKVANMSKSARGTIDNPGENVKQKAGLNRSILDQGWHSFKVMLDYKIRWRAGKLIEIDPRHTSQKCSCCGFVCKDNRRTQQVFFVRKLWSSGKCGFKCR